MPNQNDYNKLMEFLSKQTGTAAGNKQNPQAQINQLMQNMNRQDAEKLQQLLNNPEETKKILNSPQAQALMKFFSKGG